MASVRDFLSITYKSIEIREKHIILPLFSHIFGNGISILIVFGDIIVRKNCLVYLCFSNYYYVN